jgi:phosphoserine phosphatase RsbU/P
MLNTLLQSLRQEYRTRRMGRIAAWVLAYGVALLLLDLVRGTVSGPLQFLFWFAFTLLVVYYLFRLVRVFRQQVLWSLRRRLIVTYVFIAIVPILLIVGLVYIGMAMINGQLAAFLVASKLKSRYSELQQLNRAVTHEARLSRFKEPKDLVKNLRDLYASELVQHAISYPRLEITVRVGRLEEAFDLGGQPLPKAVAIPPWIQNEEFAGIVVDENEVVLRVADQEPTAVGPLTVVLSEPLTPQLLDHAGQGVGPVGVLIFRQSATGPSAPNASGLYIDTPQGMYAQSGAVRSQSLQLPRPANLLDFSVRGAAGLDPILWGGDKKHPFGAPVLLYTTSRIITLNRRLFSTLGELSGFYRVLFVVIAAVFVVIELFALIIGSRLTRSITTTVDRLHDATERVKVGDFSHRIRIPARDQLSSLGEAFDSMTASVQRLLLESQERSRLESELEIAREVQTQLFPQNVPEVPGLRLYGVCRAARVVSGDYYDFLRLDENRVGVVLGDISGKGISAALLMAAIQSALHAQFYNGHSSAGARAAAPVSTAQVVSRLNRQVFDSTPREKYVTFFYAVYDGRTRRLTYTNAGHCPPVVFRHGKAERLEAGGTVVGLFSEMTYEQAEMTLQPGDLLLAFTDGLVEPENSYEEEFGESRLLEAARRAATLSPEQMAAEIYRSVNDWTGSPELQDDMTLVVGQAL